MCFSENGIILIIGLIVGVIILWSVYEVVDFTPKTIILPERKENCLFVKKVIGLC